MRKFAYGNKTLDEENLVNVISSAMETGYDGIGSWGLENGTKNPDDWGKAREESKAEHGGAYYANVFCKALENGATIYIEDAEAEYEDETEIWELTWEKLENGCAIFEKETGQDINRMINDGCFDAYDAQLIFQYALFGEEVYA